MDRAYVYSKMHFLLGVFVAFDFFNDEDEKPGGDNEEMDQKKGS